MKNVYDIKQKKNLNFILPVRQEIKKDGAIEKNGKVVIIIHLYYLDTIKEYIKYINVISDDIDVIFTASSSEVKEVIQKSIIGTKKNCRIIEMQNRGRDIGALLVASRKDILKYEYVCFLHDKKEKRKDFKKETGLWIECLWENMLGSAEYIDNILETFYQNENLGILAPPPPISEHFPTAYVNTWYQNFALTKKLAENMNLRCDLNEDKPPLTLGTVFWAKVDALKKLVEKEWHYEDFDEEPLRDDGTISHAIERILSYVAQDAGYDTGWVMTDSYAAQYITKLQNALTKAFTVLDETYGIRYISELDTYKDESQRLKAFCEAHGETYIYGAGQYAAACYKLLKSVGIDVDGFVVSKKTVSVSSYYGHPILEKEDIMKSKNRGIIIAVSWKYQIEILDQLHEYGIKENDICIFQRG